MTWAMRLNGGDLIVAGKPVRQVVGADAFTVAVLQEGTQFGNPEPLTKTINTLMTQGSWEVVDRVGNRLPTLSIQIQGETAAGLNAGEVWLSALMRPGVLEWLPPGQTVWTCFDLVTVTIDRTYGDRWDLDERRWERIYDIPIRALPRARSRELTVTAAGPVTGVVDVLVNDGSSATNWAATAKRVSGGGATYTPTLSVVSGKVRNAWTAANVHETDVATLTYTATVATTGAVYVRVDWTSLDLDAPLSATLDVKFPVAGYTACSLATTVIVSGVRRAYFRLPTTTETSIDAFRLTVTGDINQTPPAPPDTPRIEADQIRFNDTLPTSSANGRQKMVSLVPGGSAPAYGNFQIYSDDSTALGTTLIYTYPPGRPSPALMQYRTAPASGTTDSNTLHGTRYPTGAADLVLTVPDDLIHTRGLVALWAKLRCDTAAATVTWTVKSYLNGTQIGTTQTGAVPLVGDGLWRAVPLGLPHLPIAETGSAGSTVVTLRTTSGSGTVFADEVWTVGTDEDSALTIIDCGTGTVAIGGPSSSAWIDAPSSDVPAGRVLCGIVRTNARTPAAVQSQQVHTFPNEGTTVLLAGFAGPPSASLSHYRRWTHHAST